MSFCPYPREVNAVVKRVSAPNLPLSRQYSEVLVARVQKHQKSHNPTVRVVCVCVCMFNPKGAKLSSEILIEN